MSAPTTVEQAKDFLTDHKVKFVPRPSSSIFTASRRRKRCRLVTLRTS